MPTTPDPYSTHDDPAQCGHPNMIPVTYRTSDGQEHQGAECPNCHEAWPR